MKPKDYLRTVYGQPLPNCLVNLGSDEYPIIASEMEANYIMQSVVLNKETKVHISTEYDRLFGKCLSIGVINER